jgi:ferrous iron transport protein A
MMPLTFAPQNEVLRIQKIGGNPEMKKHLEDMGFVVGGKVTVVSTISGNLIVSVKETRVALDRSMASRIMV